MKPKFSFTIPSLHDDTTLDCRIYYTSCDNPNSTDYPARGAIIAHPYAPLGGSYDDPVVAMIKDEILGQHYGFVCTFNFRGAYGGTGHTSWTGKAEKADYESVIGFMIEFLQSVNNLADLEDQTFDNDTTQPVELVIGGYSYGSWIATHIQDPLGIWQRKDEGIEGSAAAEIKSRAQHLAAETKIEIQAAFAGSRVKHRHTLSVGGDDRSPEKGNSGESSPRSASHIRKSVDVARKLGAVRRKHPDDQENRESICMEPDNACMHEVKIAYLLISPLLPPISTFTTWPFGSNALKSHTDETLTTFAKNPTLVIYGSDDAFTSGKKLRNWAQDIASKPNSKFQFVEIDGEGHFWRTHTSHKLLKLAVSNWIKSLIDGGDTDMPGIDQKENREPNNTET